MVLGVAQENFGVRAPMGPKPGALESWLARRRFAVKSAQNSLVGKVGSAGTRHYELGRHGRERTADGVAQPQRCPPCADCGGWCVARAKKFPAFRGALRPRVRPVSSPARV